MDPSIIYTWTDEAPALATHSLLPVIEAFCAPVGVPIETRDISVAGRILAAFPERLTPEQRVADDLAELARIVQEPTATVIKLPNISASLPQLRAAIAELQAKGYDLPDYPESPTTDAERDIRARYDRVKGSAVNPVLREGNSDRRAAEAVKAYARRNPHRMGAWDAASKAHVAAMADGDFYATERSVTVDAATTATIRFTPADGGPPRALGGAVPLEAAEIVDAAVLRREPLRAFLAEQIADAKREGVLFSVHLKATMMKVSDPIIFGHAVEVFLAPVFERYGTTLERIGARAANGLADILTRLEALPSDEAAEIRAAIDRAFADGPGVSMVDSDRGITNFHVPSDFIIDATMPAAIRAGGKTWGPDGAEHDTKFVIPDRCYAPVYQAVIEDCRKHGAFDPATMGSVPNVGLMAQKAEEYGSHDTTFEAPASGTIDLVAGDGSVILSQHVDAGDIYRVCRVKDRPVYEWVRLAVERARLTGAPAVFWLDSNRAHDAQIIRRVERYLADFDTTGLEISVMPPAEATRLSVTRARAGLDTISVTGNVLRDYLTDLFPILELGTSAKMLSIVPLMGGGRLLETGAGGSAPKHVQQFVKEGHLRWDSLGEFMALAEALQHLGRSAGNGGAELLGAALHEAVGDLLDNRRSPSRAVHELDNRGSHFYLALYWARAVAKRATDHPAAAAFARVADELEANEATIVGELNAAQGAPVDLGGYYRFDRAKADAAMRPSATFNAILASISA